MEPHLQPMPSRDVGFKKKKKSLNKNKCVDLFSAFELKPVLGLIVMTAAVAEAGDVYWWWC